MILKEVEGIRYWQYELLSDVPNLIHATLQRYGGASQNPYYSLNTSFFHGDSPEIVSSNLQKIQKILKLKHLCWNKQVHQSNILEARQEGLIGEGDGLITENKNLGLMINHADCQSAIIYDPILHKVSNIHAGWRGLVQKIFTQAVKRMQERFGSKPANLLVCLSPSLGPEVAEFIHYKREFPEWLWKYQTKTNLFDLWAASEEEFLQAGIKGDHIELSRICTYLNHDYFSYRRQNITGRAATIVALL